MRVWRLARQPYSDLGGVGGLYTAGRWHARGQPVVYLAQSLALASWEVFVNLDLDAKTLPADYVQIAVDVPDEVAIDRIEDRVTLPDDWRHPDTGHRTCRPHGQAWLAASGTAALLSVPSAVVPAERNYLLKPSHPDAALCSIAQVSPFVFDQRVLELYARARGGD